MCKNSVWKKNWKIKFYSLHTQFFQSNYCKHYLLFWLYEQLLDQGADKFENITTPDKILLTQIIHFDSKKSKKFSLNIRTSNYLNFCRTQNVFLKDSQQWGASDY